MRVILLQRVDKLGHVGDIVEVAAGYARNFLLPKGFASRATKENLASFEEKRKIYEEANLKQQAEAEKRAAKFTNIEISIIAPAQTNGVLYGSITSRKIAEELEALGHKVPRSQIDLSSPIKEVGAYEVILKLHPEVASVIKVFVGGSFEELSAIKNPEAAEQLAEAIMQQEVAEVQAEVTEPQQEIEENVEE